MQLFITFLNSCAWINRFKVLVCYRIATSYERANYGIFIEVAKIGDQATTKTSPGQEKKACRKRFLVAKQPVLENSKFFNVFEGFLENNTEGGQNT